MTDRSEGIVKFYSQEKGYGFIFDLSSQEDVYFHIRSVLGPFPPKAQDRVEFLTKDGRDSGKKEAIAVEILNCTPDKSTFDNRTKKYRELDGFPCIRSETLRGFKIQRDFGHITAGRPVVFFQSYYRTMDSSRSALIRAAASKGANAIFGFYFHSYRKRERGFFGGFHSVQYFWTEGRAVFLVPD